MNSTTAQRASYGYVEVPPCLAKGRFLGWQAHKGWVSQLKYDGERRIAQIINGRVYMTGRRKGVSGDLSEKGRNLYHLQEPPKELEGAIFDGEVYVPGGHSEDMMKIMGCGSAKEAKARIDALQFRPQYAIFDIIALPGREFVTTMSLRERLNLLKQLQIKEVFRRWPCTHLALQLDGDAETLYDCAIQNGEEGVVLKDPRSRYVYGPCGSWVKVKPEKDATVICVGFQKGEPGKYQDTLGALIYRGTVEGRYVTGTVSGMTDDEREQIWSDPEKYMSKPFDVRYARVTGKSLIQARFDRWRWDL